MGKRQIVIITSAGDPHVQDVAAKLRQLEHEPMQLHTNDIPLNSTMSMRWSADEHRFTGGIAIGGARQLIEVERPRSIWWRRPGAYYGIPNDLSEQEREFAKGEIDQFAGAFFAMQDGYWISYPDNIRRASLKLEQLARAARYGFAVPDTVVANDPEVVRGFYDAHAGDIVFKVLTDPMLGALSMAEKHPDRMPAEPRATITTRITSAELEQLDGVRLVPSMFQAYVSKRTELRVTVIGDELFVVEIDSQSHEGTAVDWRNWGDGGFDIEYRATTLPDEIASRCVEFVRSYGLNFSAIDLILTPEGEYVFLENNPNGQFIWIEKRVPELRMIDALSACLIRGAN